jgi:hypothetical protein
VLAVVTTVNNANIVAGSAQGILDGFQAAVVVSVIAAGLGVPVSVIRFGRRTEPVVEAEPELERISETEAEPEAEAA